MTNRRQELADAIKSIDDQIAQLRDNRASLHREFQAIKFGFGVGDKIRHKENGKQGIVHDFTSYWPRIKKLRKDGSPALYAINIYDADKWEKINA